MRSRFALGALLAVATLAPVAHAETFRTEDPDAKKDYLAAISKGEAAFVAKDMAGARTAFQDAIKLDASRMLGLYRLGEVQMAESKFDESVSTLQGALGKKGPNLLKAKVMYLIGFVHERAHHLPQAKEAFNAYITFVQANGDAKGVPQIAEQHVKVIDRRMKDEVAYAAVKERIKAREKEKEKEAIENAKKDTKNR
ncbi:MAG TPA: hypothetical protein VHB21_15085 [Minicystis sp.]|nr:hypothetical protein [Minicystis sp.]